MREYAAAPDVTVYGDPKFSFAYVPSHLHNMTFELVHSLAPMQTQNLRPATVLLASACCDIKTYNMQELLS